MVNAELRAAALAAFSAAAAPAVVAAVVAAAAAAASAAASAASLAMVLAFLGRVIDINFVLFVSNKAMASGLGINGSFLNLLTSILDI